jgi:hypothetical protein
MAARIRVLCRDGGGLTLHGDQLMTFDDPLLVGREGDLGVGVSPVDPKVSRHAAKIERTAAGWHVTRLNRNGIIVQPWGQAPGLAETETTLAWPRVALRVVGSPHLQHWVLLDDPELRVRRPEPSAGTHLTETGDQPRPLTVAQEQAVRTLFGELLAWPPRVPATPMQLKQVASRLNVRPEAIQRRLEDVRRKASSVGLARVGLLTDPEYLYILVRAGYVQPTDDELDPVLCTPDPGN